MAFLSGKRLFALGAALIAVAGVAVVRVALSGDLRRAGTDVKSPAAAVAAGKGTSVDAAVVPGSQGAEGMGALSTADHVALALSAEKRGDVAAALSHYRAAVDADPGCVDSRSPGFLGGEFEVKLKGWIAGIRSGRIAAGRAAMDDASFIFRRMYGGCG